MIDKLDLRVPYQVSFRPEFRFVANEVRYAGQCSTVQRAKHYQGVVDLRPFGYDAMLHAYLRTGERRNHKLELFQTGSKTLPEMAKIVSDIFDVNPYELENMRVDFAADMPGIPVAHLHNAVRVKFKRSQHERGETDYEVIGGRRLEYFRYGVSPNCVRIYDKPAECKARFPEILKRVSRDAELPTFEQTFGFPENTVLSRVERQAGGGRIPPELTRFADLERAGEFNPFTSIEILPDAFPLPDPEQHGESGMLKLLGTRDLIDRYGYQAAYAILNRNGNGKRYMDTYKGFLQASENSIKLTTEAIVASYRASVLKQIQARSSLRNPCKELERFPNSLTLGADISAPNELAGSA